MKTAMLRGAFGIVACLAAPAAWASQRSLLRKLNYATARGYGTKRKSGGA